MGLAPPPLQNGLWSFGRERPSRVSRIVTRFSDPRGSRQIPERLPPHESEEKRKKACVLAKFLIDSKISLDQVWYRLWLGNAQVCFDGLDNRSATNAFSIEDVSILYGSARGSGWKVSPMLFDKRPLRSADVEIEWIQPVSDFRH